MLFSVGSLSAIGDAEARVGAAVPAVRLIHLEPTLFRTPVA
ncbi:hypothetical protein ACWEQV_13910 [Rhodococcus aetherivorans]